MRRLRVAAWAVLFALLSGCTVRVVGDASMFKKYDRPTEDWSVETKGTQQVPKPTEVKK